MMANFKKLSDRITIDLDRVIAVSGDTTPFKTGSYYAPSGPHEYPFAVYLCGGQGETTRIYISSNEKTSLDTWMKRVTEAAT